MSNEARKCNTWNLQWPQCSCSPVQFSASTNLYCHKYYSDWLGERLKSFESYEFMSSWRFIFHFSYKVISNNQWFIYILYYFEVLDSMFRHYNDLYQGKQSHEQEDAFYFFWLTYRRQTGGVFIGRLLLNIKRKGHRIRITAASPCSYPCLKWQLP